MLRKKWGRLFIRAASYLAGGLVASLFLAWGGLAVRGSTRAVLDELLSPPQGQETTWYHTPSREQDWYWLFTQTRVAFAISALHRMAAYQLSNDELKCELGKLPGWVEARDVQPQSEQYEIDLAIGWPMRMLSAHVTQPSPRSWRVHGGIEVAGLPIGRQTAGASRLVLPLTPLPMGVVVNTFIYAVLLWSMMVLIRVVRSSVRRSNMRCPNCAYDITGLTTCPECGQPVASKA